MNAKLDPFTVKQYDAEGPILKGNGFDGLRVGEDRTEAEAFVRFVNSAFETMSQFVELYEAVRALKERMHDTPTTGYLRDTDASRASLRRVFEACERLDA